MTIVIAGDRTVGPVDSFSMASLWLLYGFSMAVSLWRCLIEFLDSRNAG
jgi:hypothetical protein